MLLHLGRLPSPGERRLLDAILIGVARSRRGRPVVRRGAAGRVREPAVDLGGDRRRRPDHRRRPRRRRLQLHGAHRRRAGAGEGRGADRPARRRSAPSRPPCAPSAGCPGSAIASTPTDPRVKVLFDMARAEGSRRRRHRLHAGARGRGRRAHQAAADEHRRRAGRDPARHGIRAAGRAASSSSSAASPASRRKWPRSTSARSRCASSSTSSTTARRRRPSETTMARTITAEETDVVHELVGRARAAMARHRPTTTRRRSTACAAPSAWAGGNERPPIAARQHERGRERHGQPRADAAREGAGHPARRAAPEEHGRSSRRIRRAAWSSTPSRRASSPR